MTQDKPHISVTLAPACREDGATPPKCSQSRVVIAESVVALPEMTEDDSNSDMILAQPRAQNDESSTQEEERVGIVPSQSVTGGQAHKSGRDIEVVGSELGNLCRGALLVQPDGSRDVAAGEAARGKVLDLCRTSRSGETRRVC